MKDYESYTILTIDDEEVIRYSFKNFLEDFGYNVIAAENGKKGLAVFNEHKPDLVLVDLRMPVMDGLEVLENLKKNSPDTPVIVVSGTGEIKDVIEALRLGAWDYLLKPVEDLSVLLHTIQKSFERLELIKENRSYQHHLEEKVEQRTQEIFLKNIELKQINNRLRKIVETTKHISLCRDFNQFGIKLLKEFGDHMLAEGGSIYSIEKNGLSLLFSLDPGHAKSFVEFPLKENSILNQVISGKKSLLVKNEEEISAYHGSGWDRYKNSSILAFPLSDEDGNIIAVITLHSKHKPPFIEQDKEIGSILASYSCEVLHTIRANEALQKREEQFRLVIQASYDGMIAINKKGLITIFNPAAEKIFGQKKEDMIGHTLVNLMPKFYRKSHKKNVKSFFSSGKPNNVINKTLQLEALHKNGTILPIELSLSVSKQDDEPFVLGMVRDITKRKQSEEALLKSEEKFKLLFAEIPDALFITSLKEKNKGQILDVNPAAELQTGYNKKELLKMNIVYDLIVEHQDEQFITNNLKKIISGQYIQFVEKKKRKDGEEYWTEVLLSKITINQDDVVLSVNRDITKQKWAQDELIASEHKFRMFTEAAPVAIMIYQGDKFIYVNKESTHITGYSSEELLKMNFWDIVHPDYKELIKTRGMQRQTGEKPENRYEFIVLSKSGKEIWIDFRAEIIEYKGKTAVLLTAMDINERKRSENLRQVSYNIVEAANTANTTKELFKIMQRELSKLINTTNFIFAFHDKTAKTLSIPYMEDQKNFFTELPIENTYSSLVFKKNKSVLLNGEEVEVIKRKNNINSSGANPKSWLGVPMEIDKNVSGIIVVQDYEKENAFSIEDQELLEFVANHVASSIKRKQAEEEIRKLSQAVVQNPSSIIITDTEGNIVYVNPKFEKISGYSMKDVKGKNPGILKSGKTSQKEYENLWNTIKAGKEWRGEFQNIKKDGSLFYEYAHISPILNDNNEITHFLGIKEDISERKLLQEQLNQAQKMESIGRLAGGIAHDFNNLLSPILGYTDMLLLTTATGEKTHDRLTQIKKAAERARDLTSKLLAFGRKQILEIKVVELSSIIKEFEKILRRTLRENIELTINLSSSAKINADISQIEQIIMNLVVNAQDAMPIGGQMKIETKNVTFDNPFKDLLFDIPAGNYLLLSVSDTGIGMNENLRQNIFEPFFTTKEKGKGTGLGLATVHGIIKQHNGFIQVQSKPNHGSTFNIYFPVVKTDLSVETKTKPQQSFKKGNETILIVEDDKSVKDLVCNILEQYGYTVISTVNPQNGLELANKHKSTIQLLLTDVIMPQMNGKDLYHLLIKIIPDLKVLFMSGYTDDIIARHGMLEEGVHFIQKPITLENLTSKIREALED